MSDMPQLPQPVIEQPNMEAAVREGAVKAKEKRIKTGGKVKDVPKELAPRWEMIVQEAAKRIKAKRDKIKEVIGERPYQGIPLEDFELEVRLSQMRDNPELQKEALTQNVKKTKDGRLLINKAYLKVLTDYETKIKKGVIST